MIMLLASCNLGEIGIRLNGASSSTLRILGPEDKLNNLEKSYAEDSTSDLFAASRKAKRLLLRGLSSSFASMTCSYYATAVRDMRRLR